MISSCGVFYFLCMEKNKPGITIMLTPFVNRFLHGTQTTAYGYPDFFQPPYHFWFYDLSGLLPCQRNLPPECGQYFTGLYQPRCRGLFFVPARKGKAGYTGKPYGK